MLSFKGGVESTFLVMPHRDTGQFRRKRFLSDTFPDKPVAQNTVSVQSLPEPEKTRVWEAERVFTWNLKASCCEIPKPTSKCNYYEGNSNLLAAHSSRHCASLCSSKQGAPVPAPRFQRAKPGLLGEWAPSAWGDNDPATRDKQHGDDDSEGNNDDDGESDDGVGDDDGESDAEGDDSEGVGRRKRKRGEG